jgi:hypothetical protein
MTVEATTAPNSMALTPMTQKALQALLLARVDGHDNPQLAADFSHEVGHDVQEGRMDEGQAKALLLAYGAPVPDMTETRGRARAEAAKAAPPAHHPNHQERERAEHERRAAAERERHEISERERREQHEREEKAREAAKKKG